MNHMEILFKEYDTWCTEIIARQSGGYQLMLIAGAVFGWFLSHANGRRSWLVFGALTVLFISLVYRAIKDVAMISGRLQELETEINHLAGAELLTWEHRCGWGRLLRKHS